MGKTSKRFCYRCKKATEHSSEKLKQGGERIMLGIITFGFSEISNNTMHTCLECGKISI